MTPPGRNARECNCRNLQRLSKEPTAPIEFDTTLNEYHIVHSNGGQTMIYYCPICGGATPRSRRDEFFAHIPHAEMERLIELTAELTTISDVVKTLGPADWDNPTGQRVTKDDDEGRPVTKYYRTLTYRGLSTTANVVAIVYVDDRVQFSFMPKHVTEA